MKVSYNEKAVCVFWGKYCRMAKQQKIKSEAERKQCESRTKAMFPLAYLNKYTWYYQPLKVPEGKDLIIYLLVLEIPSVIILFMLRAGTGGLLCIIGEIFWKEDNSYHSREIL